MLPGYNLGVPYLGMIPAVESLSQSRCSLPWRNAGHTGSSRPAVCSEKIYGGDMYIYTCI